MFLPVLEIWLNDVIMCNKETRSPEVERMEAGTVSALDWFCYLHFPRSSSEV